MSLLYTEILKYGTLTPLNWERWSSETVLHSRWFLHGPESEPLLSPERSRSNISSMKDLYDRLRVHQVQPLKESSYNYMIFLSDVPVGQEHYLNVGNFIQSPLI